MRRFLAVLLLAGVLTQSGCELLFLPILLTATNPGGFGPDSDYPKLSDSKIIGPTGGKADPDGGTPVTATVNGRVTFDRLLVTGTGFGIIPAVENCRFVAMEAVRHDSLNTVLATTTTNANGQYSITFDTTADFYVRARAMSGLAPDVDRVVHNRTKGNVVHAVAGAILHRSIPTQTIDLHANVGTGHVRAGAFAILDTTQRLRAGVAGSFPSLGSLDVLWSAQNTGGPEDRGFINATDTVFKGPFGNPTIYLVGGSQWYVQAGNHDEFDETVIAREWASFLQLTQSRDNNFGGPHAGQELIPTASYSAGLTLALGCALLGSSLHRDTAGFLPSSSMRFEFDCKSGVLPGGGLDYGNEFAVARVVWDLLDGGAGWPADTDGDGIAVDQADFFASFAALRTRGAPYEVAWLPSLLQQLIDDALITVTDADTLMQVHGSSFPPPGGDSFPELISLGGAPISGNLNAWAGSAPNGVLGPNANAVFRIELAAPQTVSFAVVNTTVAYDSDAHRLDLTIHDLERNIVAGDTDKGRDKHAAANLASGTYIIRIQHKPDSKDQSDVATYTLDIQ